MKTSTLSAALIAASIFTTGFSATVHASDFSGASNEVYERPLLNDINGFINRNGGLDRIQEDASRGDPDASYWLGVMHRDGVVFPKNEKRAKEYFSTAAENGHADGLYEYSHQVGKSNDVRSKVDSVLILAQSAASGKAEAQYELALNYLKGYVVPTNKALGYFWLSKSAYNGYPLAIEKEKELIEKNSDLSKKFDAVYERAITGHVESLVELSAFYAKGIKVEKNKAIARELLENAAMLGSEDAKNKLGY